MLDQVPYRKRFEIGKIDSTLFTKRVNGELFVCQIYVDDIIFGSTNPHSSEKFGKLMSEKFEMSMMSELKFFLGLKIKQTKEGTCVSRLQTLCNVCSNPNDIGPTEMKCRSH